MFLRFADATQLESRVKGMGYANGLTLEIEMYSLKFHSLKVHPHFMRLGIKCTGADGGRSFSRRWFFK